MRQQRHNTYGRSRPIAGDPLPGRGTPSPIRLILVDDHNALRVPLAFMLEREEGIRVVGQAGTLTEAREMLDGVDVALVDLDLPDGSGTDLVGDLRYANPSASVLVLTASNDQRDAARAVEAGAAGVLHKSALVPQIVDTIRRLARGEPIMSPQQQLEMIRAITHDREQERMMRQRFSLLTPREREVLQALADGLGDEAIAKRLVLSPATVRTHMVNILGKLGANSRLQAVVLAIRYRILTLD